MDDLRYPVGKFTPPAELTPALRARLVDEIEEAPARLRQAVAGLSEAQIETPYRPGGWTVRQVVHHLPDSHVNAYVRFRLALTEDEPTIRPYEEALWAELPDSRTAPVGMSLALLEAVHQRLVLTLRNVTTEQWSRTLRHPVTGVQRVEQTLALYAWHGRHHVAHITRLRDREGW